ncbi:MAG: DUF167 domain-containing protein [Planctomycetaceae bacterium]|nr:DUF167 domain-containing protein [Planctomycetales bacterium]MCB9874699.1 DUF167 domain-containing protein [Planctomycetaceae bacterium]MCB9938381.1 DUF167 domain-containing protein [Planctomycetaceae bacterium]
MIALELHPVGVILPVRAQPGSKKSELRGEQDGALKIAVTQIAEKGKANKAIVALMSKQLGLRKSQIELVSGETSAQKRFLVREISVEQLRVSIEAANRDDR